MHFVREIWLRHVKCAAAREGIYFIFDISEYFTNLCVDFFRLRAVHGASFSPDING